MKKILIGCLDLIIGGVNCWVAAATITLNTPDCLNTVTCTVIDEEPQYIVAVPARGRRFLQWNDGNTDNPRIVTASSDVSYTAIFAEGTFTVTFDANGGASSTTSKSVTYGLTYGALPTPTRTGYVFAGWYTAVSGGTRIVSSTKVTITSNQTLYAHWDTYLSVGNAECPEVDTYVVPLGETQSIVPVALPGYRFKKWTDGNTDNPRTVLVNGSVTYKAEFVKTCVVNGNTYEYDEKVTLTAADSSCYHFTQWNDGNKDNPRMVTVTGDTTYTPAYEINHLNLPAVTEYPRVVEGDTLHLSKSTTAAWKQILLQDNGDEATGLWWEWNTGNGWKTYKNERVTTASVQLRYGVTACEGTQYSKASGSMTVESANADNCINCANAPAVALYEWMIMVDQKTLRANGYTLRPNQVTWYRVVGNVDDLSDDKGERNDEAVGTGLYLTANSPLTGTGKYYALIDPSAITSDAKCKGTLRTELFDFSTNGKVSMYPTMVSASQAIQLTGLPEGEDVLVNVYDESGTLRRSFTTEGMENVRFESEQSNGRYLVKIHGADGTILFKYVVNNH